MKISRVCQHILLVGIVSTFLGVGSFSQAATIETKGQTAFFGTYVEKAEQKKAEQKKAEQKKAQLNRQLLYQEKGVVDFNPKKKPILPRMSQAKDRNAFHAHLVALSFLLLALVGMRQIQPQKRRESGATTRTKKTALVRSYATIFQPSKLFGCRVQQSSYRDIHSR